MTSNHIIDLMNRRPFLSFEIRLSDGSRIRIDESFQIATRRNSPVCIVYETDDTSRFIAIRNITEIVTSPTTPAEQS